MIKIHVGLIASFLILTACEKAPPPSTEPSEKSQDTVSAELNEAQKAYAEANSRMHKGMNNIPADADEAFMVGMIPHHQGAVDMAEIVLKHGKDAETRALAEAVIKTQKEEIAQMLAWLKKRGIDPEKLEDAAVDHSAMGH